MGSPPVDNHLLSTSHSSYWSLIYAILGVMKLANFVTIARKVKNVFPSAAAEEAYNQGLIERKGKRLNIPSSHVNSLFRRQRKRRVKIEYIGPTKTECMGCGDPFLFLSDGRGRYPEYHTNACKQKAYRERKKTSP